MNKQLKYWLIILLVNAGPLTGFHYLMQPAWMEGTASIEKATGLELFFTGIFLPCYLVLINYWLARRWEMWGKAFLLNAALVIACVFLSSHLHYVNWAGSGGNYDHPDAETKGMQRFEIALGTSVGLAGLALVFFLARWKSKKMKNPAR